MPPTDVESFLHGVTSSAPASLFDYDLRDLIDWTERGGHALDHVLAAELPSFGAGLVAAGFRDATDFTRYDGNIGPGHIDPLDAAAPMSPTSLEKYAVCPAQYFYGKVLGLGAPDRPEAIRRIAPITKGSLVHEILEQFVLDVLDDPSAWSEAHLLDLAEARFDVYQERGLTGTPLLWRYERELMRRELDRFFEADDDGCEPLAAELTFGHDGEAPVVLRLPDGREIGFRGTADRVDRTRAGAIRVTDYKTGSTWGYDAITPDDPIARGKKLQLPLYGLAAQARFGDSATPVEARYWFVAERARYHQIVKTVDDAMLARLRSVLGVLVEGISAGRFPARPGEENWRGGWEHCNFCEFDRICQADRDRGLGARPRHPRARVLRRPCRARRLRRQGRARRMTTTDQVSRDAIGAVLDRTLFVEAGAGTGKTHALVNRIVSLLRAGHAMRGIAAITFTEAAASELRARIRADAGGGGGAGRGRPGRRGGDLHAARLRPAHPERASLRGGAAPGRRGSRRDPVHARVRGAVGRIPRRALRRSRRRRRSCSGPPRSTSASPTSSARSHSSSTTTGIAWAPPRSTPPALTEIDTSAIVAALGVALELRKHCTDDTDLLFRMLDDLADFNEQLVKASDELEVLHLLDERSHPAFRRDGQEGQLRLRRQGDPRRAERRRNRSRGAAHRVRAEVLDHMLVAVRGFVLDAADERRAAGRLEFHDLLVRARDLIRDNAPVRRALADRYTHLLIDEFQDTDPLQVELAVPRPTSPRRWFDASNRASSSSSATPSSRSTGSAAPTSRCSSACAPTGPGQRHALTANFRSVPGILDWVNHVFTDLIGDGRRRGAAERISALEPTRTPAEGDAPVVVLGDGVAEGRRSSRGDPSTP